MGITIDQTQGDINWLEVFTMPIQIKVNYIDGADTLVSVFNDQLLQYFSFDMNKEVSDIEFDPDNWILKEVDYNPDMTVDISESILQQIAIYPNPNSGSFYLNLPDQLNDDVYLRIFNLNGQLIYLTKVLADNKERIQINPNNIESGFYIIELDLGKKIWVRKLIVN